MSIVAEYETEFPRLSEALRAVPEVTLRQEDVRYTADREVKWVFWASGGDESAFLETLHDDPTFDRVRRIVETDAGRLYSTRRTVDPEEFILTVFDELDVQILDATYSSEGTTVRVRAPSREAYAELGDVVEGEYGTFRTRRLYRETAPGREEFDVTAAQREALVSALEAGYFEVPRRIRLETVADELGISDNAASARLRRGTAALVRNAFDGG